MCPACIGSALLMFSGASSTGGLVLIASRIVGRRRAAAAEARNEPGRGMTADDSGVDDEPGSAPVGGVCADTALSQQ